VPALLKRVIRLLAWPVRRYFGTQFEWTRAQVREADQRVQERIDRIESGLVATIRHELDRIREHLAMAALSGTEALADVGHELRLLGRADAATPLSAGAEWRDAAPGARATVVAPYVFRALAGLGPGSRVLLLGPANEGLALSLAALGYRVSLAGARAGAVEHPLIAAIGDEAAWEPPERPFHAVISVDGVDAGDAARNGERPGGRWAMRASLEALRGMTGPDGRLVVASLVPPGPDRPGILEGREADGERLGAEAWTLEDRTVVQELGAGSWRAVTGLEEPASARRRLVLLTARAAGERTPARP
jgi:hypothetical protein